VSEDLRDEYQFDYRQAKPNRFAAAVRKGGRLVELDPDVAAAFADEAAVNAALREYLRGRSSEPTPA
jgi:hypothetical protein